MLVADVFFISAGALHVSTFRRAVGDGVADVAGGAVFRLRAADGAKFTWCKATEVAGVDDRAPAVIGESLDGRPFG